MRTLAVSLICSAVVVALAAPASAAAQPVIVHRQAFNESTPSFYMSCGSVDIVATASGVVTTKQFFDTSGALVAEAEAYSFTGTLYNADDKSRSLPYWGGGEKRWDYVRSTFLWTDMYQTIVDGQHKVLESGSYRVDRAGDGFLHGINADAAVLCSALA